MKLFFLFCAAVSLCNGFLLQSNDQFDEIEHPVDALEDFTNWELSDRIYGGKETKPHAYPFQVGLSILKKSGARSWCGATIISQKFILTAAHCLESTRSVTVMMGMHNRLKDEKGREEQTIQSKNFILHKSYDEDRIRNDIALIKLDKLVSFSETIQPATLATSALENLEGKSAKVIGWGYYNGKRVLSSYLQETESVIISNSECKKTFSDSVQSTNVCLDGKKGKASCNGDSGGPLFVKQGEKLIQVGIVSFGSSKGCDQGKPTVYTRITKYLKWITDNSI